MIDSHCHLNCLEGDLDKFLLAAKSVGVDHILCPGIDPDHFQEIIDIAVKYPQVSAGVGLHPNEVNNYNLSADDLYAIAQHPQVIAIGETGLDYYRDNSDKGQQIKQFIQHIEVAKALNKPLIIHARESHADILDILVKQQAGPAIFHCFTEGVEIAKAAIDIGCLISLSGIVTFKNAKALQLVAQQIDLQYLLIETDAPYLAPEPNRGKQNEPAYVRLVAEKIAALQSVEVEVVIEATTNNFKSLFAQHL